ncbi:helix-turn-helix domain-containing protein [Actinomadura kijaniata]|uniref:helix-turn-helix domain-containing protein n=1 Tax=Actinomadura kijaniata TaxID=46161 RepID=UPI000A0434B1|nr:helix-turn-helix transcriptional regulator [Actinomadura kijaniata]
MTDLGPDGSPEAIGRRVHDLRTQQGMTQRQAAPPGMDSSQISRLEHGKYAPTSREIEALAERLGCPAIYLSHGISEEEYQQLHIDLSTARDALYENRPGQAVEDFTAVADNPLAATFPTVRNDALHGRAEAWEMAGDFDAAAHQYRSLTEQLTPSDRWWGDAAAGAVRCLHKAGSPDSAIAFGRQALEQIGQWRRRPGAWGTPGLRIAVELLPAHVTARDQTQTLRLLHRLEERLGADQPADLRFSAYLNAARALAAFGNLEGLLSRAHMAFTVAARERLGSPAVLVNSYAQLLLESRHPKAAQLALDTLAQEEARQRTRDPRTTAVRQSLMEQARSIVQDGTPPTSSGPQSPTSTPFPSSRSESASPARNPAATESNQRQAGRPASRAQASRSRSPRGASPTPSAGRPASSALSRDQKPPMPPSPPRDHGQRR